MSAVQDLDVLRPEKRVVKLGGKQIDVSFIPLGITFDLEDIIRQLGELDQKELASGGPAARKAFDLTIKLCSAFCTLKNPEMDEQWFRENVDSIQLQALATEIRGALSRAYAGLDPKNAEAAQAS